MSSTGAAIRPLLLVVAGLLVAVVRWWTSHRRDLFHITPDEPGQLAIARFVGGMARWNMFDRSTWRPGYGTLDRPAALVHGRPGGGVPTGARRQRRAGRGGVRAAVPAGPPVDLAVGSRVRPGRAGGRAEPGRAVLDELDVVGVARRRHLPRHAARRPALLRRADARAGDRRRAPRRRRVRRPQPVAPAGCAGCRARRCRRPAATIARRDGSAGGRRRRGGAVGGGSLLVVAGRPDLGDPDDHQHRRRRGRPADVAWSDRRVARRSGLVPAGGDGGAGGRRCDRARRGRAGTAAHERPPPTPRRRRRASCWSAAGR